jgi:SPP1 family predicted phage head-tail adaptor
MRSGRLRHRLLLQSKVVTRDSYGAAIITWADQATVWGAIEPLSGTEYFSQAQVQDEAKVRIVIRFYDGVDTTWRVKHDNKYYDLVDVLNHDEKDRMLTLMCRQGVSEITEGGYLLLEDGFQLLLESTGSLLLET